MGSSRSVWANGIFDERSGQRAATDDGCRWQFLCLLLLCLLQVPPGVVCITGSDFGRRLGLAKDGGQVANRVTVEDAGSALHVFVASLMVIIGERDQSHGHGFGGGLTGLDQAELRETDMERIRQRCNPSSGLGNRRKSEPACRRGSLRPWF